MVVFDKIKNLRFVNVTTVAIGMDDSIRIVEKTWTDVHLFFLKPYCLRRLACIRCKRTFFADQAEFNLIIDGCVPFHKAVPLNIVLVYKIYIQVSPIQKTILKKTATVGYGLL